jgi:hypothetical protein
MIPRPETRALGEELAGILERARPMSLMPNRACVDRVDVERIVRHMGSEGELPGFGRVETAADAGVLRAAQAVEKAVRRGYQVPFTDQVRLPCKRVAELAAALRAALAG